MASTSELLSNALGTEKLTLLAYSIDLLQERVDAMARGEDVDDQIEVLDFEQLAAEHGVREPTLRAKVSKLLGPHAVLKPGKKWVIRKKKWLDYLQHLESGLAQDEADGLS